MEKELTGDSSEARGDVDNGARRKSRREVAIVPASSGDVAVRGRRARCGSSSGTVEKTVWGKVRTVTPTGPRTIIYG